MTELGFSRKQETRADDFALNVLHCRYGHVGGAIDLIDKLTTDKDAELMGHYFSTHPQSKERISHIKAYSRSHNFSIAPIPTPKPEKLPSSRV
jgi:Zn-dependent protease with chaperone function